MKRNSPGKRGVAMVIVLVLLLSLTAMVVGSLDFATDRAVETAGLPAEYQADFMAEAALDQVNKLLMADTTPYSDTPEDEWATPWHEGNLTIRIRPCNSFINIDRGGEDFKRVDEALRILLEEREETDLDDMMDNLEEWMKYPDSLGDKEYRKGQYMYKRPSYEPTNSTLRRPGELKLVAGWEWVNATWIDNHFTVWGDGKININFAPPEVIEAYLPKLEDYIPSIVYWRNEDGFEDISQLNMAGVPTDSTAYVDSLDYMTVSSEVFQADVTVALPGCVLEKRYILKRNTFLADETPELLARETMRIRLPDQE